MRNTPELVIHGTRGTLPACGAEFVRYGGDTTCFSVRTPEGLLIIDAGSGLRRLSRALEGAPPGPPMTILFTHLHMDHLIGLPAFAPLYSEHACLRFMADPRRAEDWKAALLAFMRKPYWPLALSETDADMQFDDLPVALGATSIYGVGVSWMAVPHPQQCLAYRLVLPESTVVIATDAEYKAGAIDPAFVRFCADADYLVMDATYTEAEYAAHEGWGHTAWPTAVAAAQAAGVRQLVLTHHAPDRTDAALDAIQAAARAAFPATAVAATNMRLGAQKGRRKPLTAASGVK